MDGTILFAGRARALFLASLAIASLVIFVPLLIAAIVRFGTLDANVRGTASERAHIRVLHVFADTSTSAVAFRDAVISGSPDIATAIGRIDANIKKTTALEKYDDQAAQTAWKKVETSWRYARRGRRLEQANHLVDLTNEALALTMNAMDLSDDNDRAVFTLSTIQMNRIPILRAQIHLVSTNLVSTLHQRLLTFKERVRAATILTQAQSNLASLTDSYAVVGRGNRSILVATTNDARYLHDAFDPLIATISDIVENDRYNDQSQTQASMIHNDFLRADSELDALSVRASDEANGLLAQRSQSLLHQILYTKIIFFFACTAALSLLYRFGQEMLFRAKNIAKDEAKEKERMAEQSARKIAEQALAATTAFRQIVMERAPVGIATIDTHGRVFESNPYLKEFLGDEDVSIIGEHRDRFLAFLKSENPSLNFERSFTKKDQQPRWADITVTRIYKDGALLALCMVRDITERKDVELRLNYEATHDGLTKLANRNLFRSKLGEMLAYALETEQSFAVLFIDLDLFKYVNDTYGHAAGDFVLMTVSSRLLALLSAEDLVARFGGDEFAVMISVPTDLAKAERISAAIVTSLAEPIMWGEETVNIGSSIGLALGPSGAQSAEELMRNADTAMYAAKQLGRGRYVIFDPEMQESAHQSAQLANDLQTALLDPEQIQLRYEPLVSLENNEVKGFEVLVRWNHPIFGEIPREEFMKIAEKSGTIRNLGRHVMREACVQFMALAERVPIASQYWLCVNISPTELGTPNFVESMVDVINSTHFDAKRLYLEVTENIMNMSGNQANRIMSRLRELGIRISIDDFGAGSSSLRYLQELRIDLLKVDRGFLRGSPNDESGRAILRAVVNLAASFDIPVVAEGVETADQLELVRSIGCQFVQGSVWGEPMSIGKIESGHTGRKTNTRE